MSMGGGFGSSIAAFNEHINVMLGTHADNEQLAHAIGQEHPLIATAFRDLLRHKKDDYNAFFQQVCLNSAVDGTKTAVCCHYLLRDGNGNVRIADLAARLRDEVLNYSIPRSRIHTAVEHYRKTNSMDRVSRLEHEARKLFADVNKSGEGGEVLLYVLSEMVLQFPQLLCKMPLKTNPNVHYHGVDGIHGSVDPDTGVLALYWGESKLHKSVASAIAECMASVAPYVLSDGGSGAPAQRDLELLRDHVDFSDTAMEAAFRKYLDPDDVDFLKVQFRAVCLVGFDLEDYADPFEPDDRGTIADAAANALESWHNMVKTGVVKQKLETAHLHVFCVPFPSVEAFRKAFLQELGLGHAT